MRVIALELARYAVALAVAHFAELELSAPSMLRCSRGVMAGWKHYSQWQCVFVRGVVATVRPSMLCFFWHKLARRLYRGCPCAVAQHAAGRIRGKTPFGLRKAPALRQREVAAGRLWRPRCCWKARLLATGVWWGGAVPRPRRRAVSAEPAREHEGLLGGLRARAGFRFVPPYRPA